MKIQHKKLNLLRKNKHPQINFHFVGVTLNKKLMSSMVYEDIKIYKANFAEKIHKPH